MSALSQVKKEDEVEEGYDSSRRPILQQQVRDWTDNTLLDSIRNMFVTGNWEDKDASKVGIHLI